MARSWIQDVIAAPDGARRLALAMEHGSPDLPAPRPAVARDPGRARRAGRPRGLGRDRQGPAGGDAQDRGPDGEPGRAPGRPGSLAGVRHPVRPASPRALPGIHAGGRLELRSLPGVDLRHALRPAAPAGGRQRRRPRGARRRPASSSRAPSRSSAAERAARTTRPGAPRGVRPGCRGAPLRWAGRQRPGRRDLAPRHRRRQLGREGGRRAATGRAARDDRGRGVPGGGAAPRASRSRPSGGRSTAGSSRTWAASARGSSSGSTSVRPTSASTRATSGSSSPASTRSRSRAPWGRTRGMARRSGGADGASSSSGCGPPARRSRQSSPACCPRSSPSRRSWAPRLVRNGPATATCGPTTCAARRTAACASSTSTTPGSPTHRASWPRCSSSTRVGTRCGRASSGTPTRPPAAPVASRRRATSRWSSRSCTTSWQEACRRWLASSTDEERADNEGWVREYLDRPLSRIQIEALLA